MYIVAGASSSRSDEVSTSAITVPIRLRLKASDCTITTGRRNAGAEPDASPSSAHQTSPRSTTTHPREPF
ncbi:MAG: hypothetical protein U5K74_09265 [Gemmatimonadaceae bacterium]|nr:hypothetical protein [Gemmatimonadaceae bacterium]